jgi:DNA-binding CsgD family transcriptional regulator
MSTARHHLASAVPHAERIGNRVVSTLALARSEAFEQEGAPTKALDLLTRFADHAEELDQVEDLLADGVRLATKVGDTAAARDLADRAAALASDSQIPHRQANALCCQGLVDRDPARLLRAAERYDDARRPLLGAKALEAAAEAFVDQGKRDPARAAFSRAVDLYTSLGATRDVARLQARFRAHGIRRAPRVKHRRARRGWESLTPAEAKIAALVAEGMTNPQIATRLFLSHRTVGTHVSHILGKLDVRSRIDIAREVTDRRAVAS